MKYIIMCGGPRSQRPLRVVFGETIVERTIRLLRENGVTDIAISTNSDQYDFGVPVLKHENSLTWEGFYWLNCFYPTTNPVCYIFGDVFFSPEAIKTIVEKQTEGIEFFASAPPYSSLYTKKWAEPFAFKVQDTEKFFDCIAQARALDKQHLFKRMPISWELWQVINNTPLNRIDYQSYTVINDYTVDIDTDEQAQVLIDRGPC